MRGLKPSRWDGATTPTQLTLRLTNMKERVIKDALVGKDLCAQDIFRRIFDGGEFAECKNMAMGFIHGEPYWAEYSLSEVWIHPCVTKCHSTDVCSRIKNAATITKATFNELHSYKDGARIRQKVVFEKNGHAYISFKFVSHE